MNYLNGLLFLIFSSLPLTGALAIADTPIQTVYNFSQPDAVSFQSRLTIPWMQQLDSNGGIALNSELGTGDDAFKISCSKQIVSGLDTNQVCVATIDSSKSNSNLSRIAYGLIGGVIAVDILDQAHVSLFQSAFGSAGIFQSSEQVKVGLPNGSSATYSKFEINCPSNPETSCRALLFP